MNPGNESNDQKSEIHEYQRGGGSGSSRTEMVVVVW